MLSPTASKAQLNCTPDRVWVVWGRRCSVVIGPLVMVVVAAGMATPRLRHSVACLLLTCPLGFTLNLLSGVQLHFFTVVPVALIAANTSICTLLIVGRIWYIHDPVTATNLDY